jgi:hypothetical protein
LLRRAWWLAMFTVVWNLAEGAVAITAGALAGSRAALIDFGVDSFVEPASATMLIWGLRIERRSPDRAEQVERRALRAIGVKAMTHTPTNRPAHIESRVQTSLARPVGSLGATHVRPTSARRSPHRDRRSRLRGRNSDGRDGKRTGDTGHQRSPAVNNGHSITGAHQGYY